MSQAAFGLTPCGSTRIDLDKAQSWLCQLEDSTIRRSISYVRARRVSCVHVRRFFRASEARPFVCERSLISCARTLNLERRTVFRAPHYIARNVCCIDVRTLSCRQRIDGRGSRVAGRWSTADGRWLRFAVRGLRVAGRGSQFHRSGATLLSRRTSDT